MTRSNLVLSWKSFPEHSAVQLKSKLEQTVCKVGTFSKFDNVFAANLQNDFLASKMLQNAHLQHPTSDFAPKQGIFTL